MMYWIFVVAAGVLLAPLLGIILLGMLHLTLGILDEILKGFTR